jgi:hypothetical protein
MAEKVIPGTSRAAINFIITNWSGLIIVSALPMAVMFGLGILMYYLFGGLIESLAITDLKDQQAVFEVMSKYFPLFPMVFVVEIIGLFAIAWLFVRVVRFRKNGEPNILIGSKGEFSAAGYTILYGLGIGMLTMVAYFAVFIVAIIAGLIIFGLGKIFFVFYFLFIPLIIAVYFSLFWFSCRFYVGMPAVAFGETPDFFTELWNLSRGESFAVPLRLIISLVVISVPIGIVYFAFLFPTLSPIQEAIRNSPDHQMPREMLIQIWRMMLPIQIVGIVFNFFFFMYFSVFFAEAYDRFRTKQY